MMRLRLLVPSLALVLFSPLLEGVGAPCSLVKREYFASDRLLLLSPPPSRSTFPLFEPRFFFSFSAPALLGGWNDF